MSDFPFVTGESNSMETQLRVFQEFAWDFEKQQFIYDRFGNHVIVDKNEAIKIWIFKALQTERFRYLAYSNQYGLELERFIGKVMSVQERYSELKRCIIECLMVNPYIRAIQNLQFEQNSDKVVCSFDCLTVYGEVRVIV